MRSPAAITVEQVGHWPENRAVIPRSAAPEIRHGRQTHIWNRDMTN
jgi:hypothetical protein